MPVCLEPKATNNGGDSESLGMLNDSDAFGVDALCLQNKDTKQTSFSGYIISTLDVESGCWSQLGPLANLRSTIA